MGRELRRLLMSRARLSAASASADAAGLEIVLSESERRYLTRVLRYGPGDPFAVVDGEGSLWTAQLVSATSARLLQPLSAPLLCQSAPAPQLVLVAAVVRRDFEVAVRMAVELGVDRLIPLLCERTAVAGQLRPERWLSIAAEAAEQCERLWLPRLESPLRLEELLAAEGTGHPGRFWATTRREELPALDSALEGQAGALAAADTVWLACGPEGGWTDSEEQAALAAGWQAVGLGRRILRSSTACVAGLAALSSWRQRRCGC